MENSGIDLNDIKTNAFWRACILFSQNDGEYKYQFFEYLLGKIEDMSMKNYNNGKIENIGGFYVKPKEELNAKRLKQSYLFVSYNFMLKCLSEFLNYQELYFEFQFDRTEESKEYYKNMMKFKTMFSALHGLYYVNLGKNSQITTSVLVSAYNKTNKFYRLDGVVLFKNMFLDRLDNRLVKIAEITKDLSLKIETQGYTGVMRKIDAVGFNKIIEGYDSTRDD